MTHFIHNQSIPSSDVTTIAASLGVPADVAASAAANLASGQVFLLVVSGKLASGKDTVAPALLYIFGASPRVHEYYARPLKDELNDMLTLMRAGAAGRAVTDAVRAQLAHQLAHTFHLPVEQAAHFTGDLLDEALTNPDLHARMRTRAVRRALQFLGTDVRRAQDPDYWVKLALRSALVELAAGRSVFFTDARFPNEVAHAAALGAITVRLDVTATTQLDRLSSRDGSVFDASALTHASELALDDYGQFDVRVDNDGTLEAVLDEIMDWLTATGRVVPAAAAIAG